MSDYLAIRRIRQEYQQLQRNPLQGIWAHPIPNDMREWRFVIEGPPGTAFSGGLFQGTINFPTNYPCTAPRIKMVTPTGGRFVDNQNICIEDLEQHAWQPAMSLSDVLSGFRDFMVRDDVLEGRVWFATDYEQKRFIEASLQFNTNDPVFCEMFPALAEQSRRRLQELRAELENSQRQHDVPQAQHHSSGLIFMVLGYGGIAGIIAVLAVIIRSFM
ncbi:ubiquitin-conjugating enzyme E2 J2-like [Ornithodoros turicata]|uniref:ubiquitin-conjugating enzyme E2 J2-like n=1 Tax=Ornithodoros turicata TaxID=34597 RepID=UPI00313889D8